MEIIDVKVHKIVVPLFKPFITAHDVTKNYEGFLVNIITDENINGWGESVPTQVTGENIMDVERMIKKIKSFVVGREVCVEAILEEVSNAFKLFPSVIASIDMALHDIIGKKARMPLYKLLGGYRNEIDTSFTVTAIKPEELIDEAERFIDMGAKVLKLKIGHDVEDDINRVKAIRKVFGYETRLRVDGNQGYSLSSAIKIMKKIEKYEIEFIEQPVSDISSLSKLRKEVSVPVMADESVHTISDIAKIVEYNSADYINVKLMKSCGINGAVKLIHTAEAFKIPCMIGCMIETRVGISAGAHVALALKNVHYADLDGHIHLSRDMGSGGVKIRDGRCGVEGHGLGVRWG